jgi:hypothetical protein
MTNGHHHHHGNNRQGTGQGKEKAAGARDVSWYFIYFFPYLLSAKLLFTFRTTAMTMNGHATTSTAATASATLLKRKQQQQLSPEQQQ